MGARPRIVLALGGGIARGWAHIGVLRTLVRAGYAPDVVCGTSIGASSAAFMSPTSSTNWRSGRAA